MTLASPAATAGRILDVAERLVQTRGYNGFSYADISGELRIRNASVHYHFPSKTDLGRKLVARYRENFMAALAGLEAESGDARRRLRRYAGLWARVLRDRDRMCLCGMMAADIATLPKPVRSEIRRFFDENEAWLVRVISETPGVVLAGAIEREGAPEIGRDAGELAGVGASGIAITTDALPLFAKADGVLDFTVPAATLAFAELAAQARIVHVIGTTGLSADDEAKIRTAARHAVIVKSGNMSLGVNLLAALVRQAARALDPSFDIEVLEMHHRHKVDAPSGTALMLGQAAAEGRDIDLASHSVRVRDGITGPRERGSIGFATLRGGSVIGDHSVMLAGEGEMITLSHHASDRALFARGAVKAALWAHGRKPGRYSMADVLGFTD